MAKRKTGLHRKVSSIFDGITVPKKDDKAVPPPAQAEKLPEDKTEAPAIPADISRQKKFAESPEKRIIGKQMKLAAAAGSFRRRKQRYKFSTPIPGVDDRKEKMKLVVVAMLFIVLVVVLIKSLKPGLQADRTKKALESSDVLLLPFSKKDKEVKIAWQVPKEYSRSFPDLMSFGNGRVLADELMMNKNFNSEDGENSVGDENQINIGIWGMGLVVESILYSESHRSVVIENEILYEGDVIMGATIVKINRTTIEFEKNGVEFVKTLSR